MAWSAEFLSSLRRGGSVSFRLVLMQGLASSRGSEVDGRAIEAVAVEGASVGLGSWRATSGAWSVDCQGLDAYSWVLASWTRGSILGLYATVAGIEEIIALGVMRQIRSMGLPRFTVECWDLPSALMSRLTTSVRQAALAYDLSEGGRNDGHATTTYSSGIGTATVTVVSTTGFPSAGIFLVGGAYYSYSGTTATEFTGCSTAPIQGSAPTLTGGEEVAEVYGITTYVSGLGSATVVVEDTTGFAKRTGGSGIFKIGDAYYTYTGTTATTFTGVSTTPLVGTAPTPSAGDVVAGCAYWYGHPLDIVRGIVVSSGGGGTYDYYPQAWGYGLPRSYLDNDDIDRWKALVVKVATGAYNWQIITDAAITSPGDWLQEMLSRSGLTLVMRQGLLTVRAAQVPSTGAYFDQQEHITDEDIATPWEVEHYAEAAPVVYGQVTVRSGTVQVWDRQTLGTHPVAEELVVDLGSEVFDNVYATCAEVHTRIAKWARRCPEIWRVTLRGLEWARLTPLDLVPVTSACLASRYVGGVGVSSQLACVLSVSPDWMAGTVRVELAYLPSWDGVFP